MKRSGKIAIISCIAVAIIISGLAVMVHLRQSVIEGTEHGNETISQKVNEVANAITNQNTKQNQTSNSEASESPEQRASEGK